VIASVRRRRYQHDLTQRLTVPEAESDSSDITIKIANAPRIESVYAGFQYDN
jgi:hypothetical protein